MNLLFYPFQIFFTRIISNIRYNFINKVCIYFGKIDCALKYFCGIFTSFIHSLL